MIRKSPDKQWNRQNSILFHETIRLRKAKAGLNIDMSKQILYVGLGGGGL
jgi:hypothetical protein